MVTGVPPAMPNLFQSAGREITNPLSVRREEWRGERWPLQRALRAVPFRQSRNEPWLQFSKSTAGIPTGVERPVDEGAAVGATATTERWGPRSSAPEGRMTSNRATAGGVATGRRTHIRRPVAAAPARAAAAICATRLQRGRFRHRARSGGRLRVERTFQRQQHVAEVANAAFRILVKAAPEVMRHGGAAVRPAGATNQVPAPGPKPVNPNRHRRQTAAAR